MWPYEKVKDDYTLEELGELRKKSRGQMPLKDGEKRMWIEPAYDLRNPDPSKNYGIHGADLQFAERRGDIVVSTTFYTDWFVNPDHGSETRSIMGRALYPMGVGIYVHYPSRDGDEYRAENECDLTEAGKCYGEIGSALYAEKLSRRLVVEGSAAIWEEIDQAFKEAEGTDEYTEEI